MAVLAWISIAFALLEAGFCAYLWLELQRRVLSTSVTQLLKQSSEELSKDYGRQFRAIETEWGDMYQKFSRLAGRMDRGRRDDTAVDGHSIPRAKFNEEIAAFNPEQGAAFNSRPNSRSEILRNYRRSKSNEQNSAD